MQVASSPGPSFAPASAASYSPGASGGGNPAPAPNNPDYSWVRADPGSRSEVSTTQGAAAVNAALSKLGVPYVWGGESMAEGGFDCSGLMQYAVAQATNGAVILPRTTFDMIHAGVAVSADQLQPGDLIFPNEGHVQMYIGDGKVVEAQQTGTNIMISPLGDFIAARRVL
jgi:cell wall-associated NlpC family hydrolase